MYAWQVRGLAAVVAEVVVATVEPTQFVHHCRSSMTAGVSCTARMQLLAGGRSAADRAYCRIMMTISSCVSGVDGAGVRLTSTM